MAQLSRQKWFFPMLVEMIGDFSVSYTHLTLPTTCDV